MAATSLLFSLPDPVGDANGDGSYKLPVTPSLHNSSFDLRSLSVQNINGKLQLTVALSGIENPWHAPLGWSGVTLDVFIKTGSGGRNILDDLSLHTPGAVGWQEHYRLTGFGAQHFQAASTNADTTAPQLLSDTPKVTLRGTDIIIDTPLKASDQYAYWVTTSLYTPLNASGIVAPGGNSGPTTLRSAQTPSPAPLDVLLSGDQHSVYLSGSLAPVGQTTDYRALSLLGVALVALLATMLLAIRIWRR